MPGYWDSNSMTTPVFTSTYSNSASLPGATDTGVDFSTWTLTLPTLRPGHYRLYMRGTNDLSTRANQSVLFTVNDASPTVAITAPVSGSSLTQGTLSTATGIASDADGIAGVTVRLYRKVGLATRLVTGTAQASTRPTTSQHTKGPRPTLAPASQRGVLIYLLNGW